MRLLTDQAQLSCKHHGRLVMVASQQWVKINGRPILVAPDPEGRLIVACPNLGPTIKPCTTSLKVSQGYSGFIRIAGRPVSLESVTGLTDGTPPGIVRYLVLEPGQQLVREGQ